MALSPCGTLRPNMTSSIKLEVHNVSQCRQRRIEPWPLEISTKNFVKIGPAISQICSQTDRRMHRHNYWMQYTAPLPGRSKYVTSADEHATSREESLPKLYQCVPHSGKKHWHSAVTKLSLRWQHCKWMAMTQLTVTHRPAWLHFSQQVTLCHSWNSTAIIQFIQSTSCSLSHAQLTCAVDGRPVHPLQHLNLDWIQ